MKSVSYNISSIQVYITEWKTDYGIKKSQDFMNDRFALLHKHSVHE